MKTIISVLVSAVSFGALAQTSAVKLKAPLETPSATSVEADLQDEFIPKKAADFTISNTSAYHSNYDEIQNGVPNRINADKFYNTLSGTMTYKLDNIGVFETTYTPSISATYVNADTTAGRDSDTLKDADIKNTLSMKAESGNMQYGLDFGANYHYGYTYLARGSGTNFVDYRRTDNNSNFSASANGAIAVSQEYRLGAEVSVAYQDAYADRLIWIPAFEGQRYDMTTLSAGISNDVIINDNFTLSMPITFRRQDYHNFQSFNNANDWMPGEDKRLRDLKLVGMTVAGTFELLTFSAGVKVGVMDDKSIAQVEDADMTMVDTSITLNISEKVSATATHGYEAAYYDSLSQFNDEHYNRYSLGINVKNIADLGVDAEIAHNQSFGQCNFGLGQYKNIATGLNLSFKL